MPKSAPDVVHLSECLVFSDQPVSEEIPLDLHPYVDLRNFRLNVGGFVPRVINGFPEGGKNKVERAVMTLPHGKIHPASAESPGIRVSAHHAADDFGTVRSFRAMRFRHPFRCEGPFTQDQM
jgi:hypothetical protein